MNLLICACIVRIVARSIPIIYAIESEFPKLCCGCLSLVAKALGAECLSMFVPGSNSPRSASSMFVHTVGNSTLSLLNLALRPISTFDAKLSTDGRVNTDGAVVLMSLKNASSLRYQYRNKE